MQMCDIENRKWSIQNGCESERSDAAQFPLMLWVPIGRVTRKVGHWTKGAGEESCVFCVRMITPRKKMGELRIYFPKRNWAT